MKYTIWQMVNKTSKCWYMNFVLRNRPRYCGSSIFCSLHTNHKLSTAKHFIQILRTYEYSIYAKRVSLVFRCWLLQIVLFVSFILYIIFLLILFSFSVVFSFWLCWWAQISYDTFCSWQLISSTNWSGTIGWCCKAILKLRTAIVRNTIELHKKNE